MRLRRARPVRARAGGLWELADGKELTGLPAAQGAVVPVLDPQRFVSGPTVRNARWRVDFNGLGTPPGVAAEFGGDQSSGPGD